MSGLCAMNALPFVLATPKATAVIKDVGDSNVLLRFYGWVDQTKTDFLKGRSLAIQAAKAALEGSGFGLPEPIYRLRFDEGVALPTQRPPAAADHRPATPRPSQAIRVDLDTTPDNRVESLVNQERAAGATDDLLDDRRPVE